jgi:hypothetical protein
MAFVPEGQHDSSQARSAWNHEENSPRLAGRLNRSRLRSDPSKKNCQRSLQTTKERAPMLNPGLRERFGHSCAELPNKTVSRPDASAGWQTTLICCCHCQSQFRSPSTVPPERSLSASLLRHFVPGYYQPVPPGQKPFAHRSASSSPTTGLSGRAGTREVDVNRMTRITASMLKIASSHDHGLLEQAASCDV